MEPYTKVGPWDPSLALRRTLGRSSRWSSQSPSQGQAGTLPLPLAPGCLPPNNAPGDSHTANSSGGWSPRIAALLATRQQVQPNLQAVLAPSNKAAGPWFNIKMSSYQYRKSHYGDKTIFILNQPPGVGFNTKTISPGIGFPLWWDDLKTILLGNPYTGRRVSVSK